MKKKLFLKFFLFTVLATMVTFTSCKNYDDDIDSLQSQIKELATKGEMTSQLATLQSALAAAQTDASKALTEVEKLAGLEKKVTDMMAELETTNAANFEAQKEELNTLMAELKAEVEDALGLMFGVVYSVEVYTPTPITATGLPLTFKTALEKENVFKDGITNALTFTKDKLVQVGDDFIIKVFPTSAVVTPEMISLVNSEGVAYENIKVTGLKPYKELITRSQGNGNGLWTVSVELKEYKKADFDKATVDPTDASKKIAFAVAINNGGADQSSIVQSDWDLVLEQGDYVQARDLIYFVNDEHVKNINNRYTNSSISLKPTGGTVYSELRWKASTSAVPTPATAIVTTSGKENTQAASGDDRSNKAVYPAVQGEPIKIALTTDATEVTAPTNIKGMYVVLDKDNAIESAPSELNAWNSYDYKGLNTVVTSTEASITIDSNAAIDDIIGFRVFAVNHDGTLVDPDGRAFYVSLGNPATDWTALNTIITATEEGTTVTDATSAKVDATLTKLTGATTFEWTTDKASNTAETTPAFDVYFENASGTVLFNTTSTSPAISGVDFSKVTKVYTKARGVSNWLAYKDNHAYNGKLTIKNATNHVLATIEVTFKKELPTTMEGFSVKTNQLSDGVWNAYLIPNTTGVNWTTPTYAAKGTMNLDNLFDFGTTATATLARFKTTFAASEAATVTGDPAIALTTTGTGPLEVAKSFIDNETEHATKVVYDYGKISTETKNSAGDVIPYEVTLEEFNTVYNNIYNSTYTWNWATREQLDVINGNDEYKEKNAAGEYVKALPYSDKVTYNSAKVINLYHIYGVSTYYPTAYNASLSVPFKIGTTPTPSLKVISATFVSANGVQEYFTASVATDGTTITLNPVSAATNPTADVPTTLKIVAKDIYGNDVKIDFPMTVKPA